MSKQTGIQAIHTWQKPMVLFIFRVAYMLAASTRLWATINSACIKSACQILYAIEALAREQNLTHEQRHELRLEKSLPIINEIGNYIYNERDKVLPRSPIGKAFDYCANRWISLQNYLFDGMLEIDSNLVENAIRPLALGRKNYLFAGSHDAAENIAMFYSFFGTCKQHGIDPLRNG